MASLAVGVKGIGSFYVAVRAVAILTTARHGPFLLLVMAIIAGNPITIVRCVRLVIKQDASRRGLEHEPHRFFRGLHGETGVANHAHNEQYCGKEKTQCPFTL
jgi:hypothetical protein